MKHYKIVKKTFYGISQYGDINEQVKFRPYVKVLGLFWEQLQTYRIFNDGSTMCSGSSVAFDSLEAAEKFVHQYHKVHDKVGSYTIETVSRIDLD